MPRFLGWTHRVANDHRKARNKYEYRVLAAVAVLVVLLVAAIPFIREPGWQIALLCVLFSIPGAMLGVGLCVVWRQRRRPMSKRDKRRMIASLAILQALFAALIGLAYVVPSGRERLIIITVVVAVVGIARPSIFRSYRRLLCDPATPMQRIRWTIASLAMLVVLLGATIGLYYAIPSPLGQVIVMALALAVLLRFTRPNRSGNGEF